jgi:hypothetical protein
MIMVMDLPRDPTTLTLAGGSTTVLQPQTSSSVSIPGGSDPVSSLFGSIIEFQPRLEETIIHGSKFWRKLMIMLIGISCFTCFSGVVLGRSGGIG